VRIARLIDPQGTDHLVRIEGDTAVPLRLTEAGPGRDPLRDALTAGTDLSSAPAVGPTFPLQGCSFLSPVTAPQKILAIGLNYADHAAEANMPLPTSPVLFTKLGNTINGHERVVQFRVAQSTQVDYEAELAVVIGTRAKNVTEDRALEHVFGYTACNDVSARDVQHADSQWVRGKSFDTFCPLGPWIVTADEIPDPQQLGIRCRVNGRTLQDGKTSDMVFGVAALVANLSQHMTLEPGDVILTGTPAGVGLTRTPPVLLGDGDVVEIEIDGIGVLTNWIEVLPPLAETHRA
jgi:2-keto-4-pentenoate hydratase/2-oxohepta-3-ene-1,7-dioic acid hydratase in catechol pathway